MSKKSVTKGLLAGLAGGVIALSGAAGYEAINGDLSIGGINVASSFGSVSTDTTKAVKTASGAVVSVLNYQGSGQLAGQGSGVIYKKSGNTAYIVTNNHVIAGENQLQVQLSGGQKVSANLVGADIYNDLAVLKIDASNVKTVATFADSSKLSVGEPAIALGSPLGSEYANSATEGIISSLSRQVTIQTEQGQTTTANAIQTDAAINPGNSGGALLNIKGQIIGITSSKISSTPDGSSAGITVEGMGFAIPSNDVLNIINQLEKNGKVEHPALGVQMGALSSFTTQVIDETLKVPNTVTSGVVVTGLQSGFPADTAGIKVNDVITKIGNLSVATPTDLQMALYKYKVGDTIKLTLYRGSEQKTISVKLTQTSDKLNFTN